MRFTEDGNHGYKAVAVVLGVIGFMLLPVAFPIAGAFAALAGILWRASNDRRTLEIDGRLIKVVERDGKTVWTASLKDVDIEVSKPYLILDGKVKLRFSDPHLVARFIDTNRRLS